LTRAGKATKSRTKVTIVQNIRPPLGERVVFLLLGPRDDVRLNLHESDGDVRWGAGTPELPATDPGAVAGH
jgi:hypothetical protein